MTARDHSRRDSEPEALPAHDEPAHDEPPYDGPAYAGMDALMAALLDEPLPEDALRDAEFVASHEAAVADLALLREQLGLIGDALATPGEEAVNGVAPGRAGAARPGGTAGAETEPGQVSGPATAPSASVTPLPSRPSRARRLTTGTLAAAAAASVVLVIGWGMLQPGGGASSSKSSDAAVSDQADGDAGSREGASLSREGYVACSRTIVEGAVTEVEAVPGVEQDRITVEVDRWIKPDKGEDRIVFPMSHDVDPRLKKGDHVLLGFPMDSAQPDIWTTGEAEIARERAWIEEALPESKKITCD
ncbi:hypothetical protein [Streptomyces caniscabiei]|uniref:Uncharacterized protein n=1 Tax=Streptomyces caniscabiei TaxID=2746961 RepID=A0ABU4MUA8_9ACTN|nr:hypothetical protein [Streptomyces caniscabiei]MBE4739386.1 hypothetical protein [Streptomyces caniscabiei]MBE4760541.1 hypothetical protein [Streptomyces caniscabiei]MBE4772751.1 hypothetical protein [Streptomyces caniscabiei]MBE4784680.1 hypothetical protein [Streptomyces caniscabiei]MBE4798645.1 hypothetical protein [Streptomyces caniscabiei]